MEGKCIVCTIAHDEDMVLYFFYFYFHFHFHFFLHQGYTTRGKKQSTRNPFTSTVFGKSASCRVSVPCPTLCTCCIDGVVCVESTKGDCETDVTSEQLSKRHTFSHLFNYWTRNLFWIIFIRLRFDNLFQYFLRVYFQFCGSTRTISSHTQHTHKQTLDLGGGW